MPEISDEGSVAVIVATPVATPVTRPFDDTVAVESLDDDQVTVLVKSAVDPSEYKPVAVSFWVCPAGTLAASGDTVTATKTAGNTVITAVPEIEDEGSVAVMVATPVATAVTKPVDDTVAVPVAEDDHVTELVKLTMDPSEYNPTALSCWVCPAGTLATGGETVIATSMAGSTVITAVPEIEDEGSVAVMVATPVATAVTRPFDETVAVAVLEDDHVTDLVKSAVDPSEYKPVAVSCWVCPAGTLATGGETVTATSTAGSTVITAVPERTAAVSSAVMVAAPVATAVTRPVPDTVAVAVLEDDQETELVKFAVDPSEYNPVAVSCCVSPAATFAAGGETVTATKTAGSTVITAVPEIKEDGSVAVIVAAPVATAVTRPFDDTVAVAVLEDDHVTDLVKLAVDPSEYNPVAVSC